MSTHRFIFICLAIDNYLIKKIKDSKRPDLTQET